MKEVPELADFNSKDSYDVNDLFDIMRMLRAPGGCSWDSAQTHTSIKKNLIEETYEVIEAINKDDKELMCEELGDLMMQVVFHTLMEEEQGNFDFNKVCDGICKKLIERHPHIFGTVKADTVDEVLTNWDAIKMKTKGHNKTSDSMLSVPRELPALMRAAKLQKKAADAGFDWDDASGAIDKLYEEIGELKSAIDNNDAENISEELGDVLFSAVNVSRFVKVDAEEALTASNDKFLSRYLDVERLAEEKGIDMKACSIEVLDSLWDEAKKIERSRN